ncbi:unnamed protein product [Paramecium sonneborni]|uniref:Uncharacterized protein n=1 Tax=Paramecium sonneborni TaxID=65129 RepID=A0A8S1RQ99_9CILI|nr:unnamed protein product [Paramecium sonneborni]
MGYQISQIWRIQINVNINYQQQYQKNCGGGSYDQEGNQKKIGKWVELDEGFNIQKKVTYVGEYDMNGMKVGRWDIVFKDELEKKYQEIQYDFDANQIDRWKTNREKHIQEYKQMQA